MAKGDLGKTAATLREGCQTPTAQPAMKYTVPRGDAERLFYPPRRDTIPLIEENHSLLRGYNFEVTGASFQELRASLRRKIAAGAGQPASAELRIVLGAHQPGFHGPGIVHKHAVLEEFSRQNLSLNFVVDSDVCEKVPAKIPYLRAGTIRLKEVALIQNRDNLVFEKLLVPPKKIVDSRYAEIEELLKSLGMDEILRAFREFRKVHERVYVEGQSAAKVLTHYRQGYYPTPGVQDNFISTISQTREFLIFACDIIKTIEQFHAAHNSSLKEHRRLHRIRSRANPFPDLTRDGELWELPFWGLDARGRRHKLFAGTQPRKRFLVRDNGSNRLSRIEPEGLFSLRLRPRAVCLTMFLRLFLSDLFIHGVGGGNYDRVTDRIIEKYYGVSPPRYVVCSRTKFLSGHRSEILQQKAGELREKMRRMRHNPEKFAPARDPLAGQARRILSEGQGRLSAEEHLRLTQIRRSLLKRIVPRISSVERELTAIQQQMHHHAAFRRRDLPYFLYARSEL